MKKLFLFLSFIVVLSISFVSAADNFTKGRWIDLTHEFSEETIYWPTSEPFKKTTVFNGITNAGFYYSAHKFSTSEHGGTHVDAPIHFSENRNTVDQIPLEQLIGSGVVIRITEKAERNRNYQLSVQDILDWEKNNGIIPKNSILLIDTGSSKLWPNKKAYMGTDERGPEAIQKLKFPGIHPDAAKFLISKRKIKAVGLDTPSMDFGGSKLFKTHQLLFKNNIPGFENVADLDQLPLKGFTIFALPMKIKGGSGGPLRIVAFVPGE